MPRYAFSGLNPPRNRLSLPYPSSAWVRY